MRRPFAVLAAAVALLAPRPAAADVITDFTGGGNPLPRLIGQSFTTPAGPAYDQIGFNFFSDAPPATPSAAGTLYLLSQEYLGTPAGLSPATPGFLAASTGTTGGVYQFDPALTLLPNTQYFAYSNAQVQAGQSLLGGYPGGAVYLVIDNSANSPFNRFLGDANFRVTGTAVAPATAVVPEPATLAVFAALAGAGGVVARRRRVVRA